MAIRAHIIGSKSASAELANALPGVAVARTGQSGEWAWAEASVRGAKAEAIDTGLMALAGPSFRFTTFDATGWDYALFAEGRPAARGSYSFALLGDDVSVDTEGFRDLAEYARLHNLPGEDVEALTGTKVTLAGMRSVAATNTRRLVEALTSFGICQDEKAVADLLNGTGVTAYELSWDVGNLPRLLATIGIEDVPAGWRDELAEEGARLAESEARLEAAKANPLAGLRRRLGPLEAMPVVGGPVELPLVRLRDLWRTADFVKRGFEVGVSLQHAGNEDLLAAIGRITEVVGVAQGRIELSTTGVPPMAADCLDKLGTELTKAADGSSFEFLTGRWNDEDGPEPNQRFVGTLSGGLLRIEGSYPPLTAAELAGALDLIDQARNQQGLTVADENERDMVLHEVADAALFFHGPPVIEADGLHLIIYPKAEILGVVEFVFHRRYAHVWDVRARTAFLRQAAADQAERRRAFEAQHYPGLLEALRIEPAGEPSNLDTKARRTLAAAERARLRPMGWLLVTFGGRATHVCCFASKDGDVTLSVNCFRHDTGEDLVSGVDVVSHLADGWKLTTSSSSDLQPNYRRKIFKFRQKGGVTQLLRQHRKHIKEFGRSPERFIHSLDDMAASIRAYLEAELGELQT